VLTIADENSPTIHLTDPLRIYKGISDRSLGGRLLCFPFVGNAAGAANQQLLHSAGSRITQHNRPLCVTIWHVSTELHNRPPSEGARPRLTLGGYYNSFTDC